MKLNISRNHKKTLDAIKRLTFQFTFKPNTFIYFTCRSDRAGANEGTGRACNNPKVRSDTRRSSSRS